MREQLKLYHWQTHSYARHKATDDVISSLDGHIDEFVEVYMGKYGRPKMTTKTASMHISNMTEKGAVTFINKCIKALLGDVIKNLDAEHDSDLMNIRDEMLADLSKLLYLFTLR